MANIAISERLDMLNTLKTFTFAILISCSFVSDVHAEVAEQTGYVIDANHRITVLDINNGKVLRISPVIAELGGISSIDLDRLNQRLFIASDRGIRGKPFVPLVVVDLQGNEFNTLQKSQIEQNVDSSRGSKEFQNAVYSVDIPPNSNAVFVGDAANPQLPLITILDHTTLEVIGRANIPVRRHTSFSADGTLSDEIWPAHKKQLADGSETILPGGVAVFNIFKGKVISKKSLINNQGLQPPWAKLNSPFIYLNMQNRHLVSYHRDTGKVLSDIDLQALTGCIPNQTYATTLANPNQVAISMSCPQKIGTVVVIDAINKSLIHKIEVGPNPTNIVVSSK